MPISLTRKNTSNNLLTIPSNKKFRAQRVRSDLDRVFIEGETQGRAQYLGLPYIDLYGFPIDTAHLNMIDKEAAQQTKMGIFAYKNKEVFVTTPEPNLEGQQEILRDFLMKGIKHKMFLCSSLSFQKLLKTYDNLLIVEDTSDEIDIDEKKLLRHTENLTNLQEINQILAQTSTSEIIETILIAAIQNKASDIHFEPEKNSYHLRLRLDGVLHTFAQLQPDSIHKIESRLKILASLKLNVENKPQDGRFSFKYQEREIDVRVSMLPSNYGYSIVLRLLGNLSVDLDLEQLGFLGMAKERVARAIEKPQGLILTTGPTGSGKTTTLYTFLSQLNDGESKIITLEDPVEYKLEGLSQTQINAEAGYTFAAGLRSILRQDPDVVMVGEIRDQETAEIAIQAALTGHQVLSTIHTNDAAGAIPRLMEMNIKGFLLADALSVVIGQRLVRKLCPHCMVPDIPTPEQKAVIIEQLSKLPPQYKAQIQHNLQFWTSRGCEKCNSLGYKGRVGVYEVMTVTDGLRTILSTQFPSIVQVRQIACQEGMLTMFQDGLLKALQGITDLKELIRNVQS